MSANLHGEWDAYQKLDQLGDLLVALNELVDFERDCVCIETIC